MLKNLIRLCQTHGIAYPIECSIDLSSYTCYNYGPRGARLRRNIINEWWKNCNRSHGNMHLIENLSTGNSSTRNGEQFLSSLSNGILQHYFHTLNQVRSQLPFGAAQIGRCTKPVSSDNPVFIYSSAEQTDLTLHFYVPPSEAAQYMDRLRASRLKWWTKFAKTPLAFTVPADDRGDAGKTTSVDIQYAYPWGADTVESIRNHGNKPLSDMQDILGVSLEGVSGGRYVLPDLLEVRTSVEWAMSAFLSDAYHEATSTDTQGDKREVLRLHPRLVPHYVALVTEGNNGDSEDLAELTRHLAAEMRGLGLSVLDVHEVSAENASYTNRFDETGVMWTVILSQKTLEGGITLLRNRDTTIKERVNIADLCKRLMYHLTTS